MQPSLQLTLSIQNEVLELCCVDLNGSVVTNWNVFNFTTVHILTDNVSSSSLVVTPTTQPEAAMSVFYPAVEWVFPLFSSCLQLFAVCRYSNSCPLTQDSFAVFWGGSVDFVLPICKEEEKIHRQPLAEPPWTSVCVRGPCIWRRGATAGTRWSTFAASSQRPSCILHNTHQPASSIQGTTVLIFRPWAELAMKRLLLF